MLWLVAQGSDFGDVQMSCFSNLRITKHAKLDQVTCCGTLGFQTALLQSFFQSFLSPLFQPQAFSRVDVRHLFFLLNGVNHL